MSSVKIAGSAPVSRHTASQIFVTAIALSGVFSDGFQIVASPQTAASAAFHDHTATGKLNAEMTATNPRAGVAARGSRCNAPFQERFLRARDRCVVIFIGRRPNAGKSPSIDRRDLVDLGAATAPFAVKDSGVVLGQAELLDDRLHRYLPR